MFCAFFFSSFIFASSFLFLFIYGSPLSTSFRHFAIQYVNVSLHHLMCQHCRLFAVRQRLTFHAITERVFPLIFPTRAFPYSDALLWIRWNHFVYIVRFQNEKKSEWIEKFHERKRQTFETAHISTFNAENETKWEKKKNQKSVACSFSVYAVNHSSRSAVSSFQHKFIFDSVAKHKQPRKVWNSIEFSCLCISCTQMTRTCNKTTNDSFIVFLIEFNRHQSPIIVKWLWCINLRLYCMQVYVVRE